MSNVKTITRAELNALPQATQQIILDAGTQVIEAPATQSADVTVDLFKDAPTPDSVDEDEPLGIRPNVADYTDRQEYFADIVEWLAHKKQEPILLTTEVNLANNKFGFNPIRLNTKFNLVNEYNDKLYYRIDEIKYCLAVIDNGIERVEANQCVSTSVSVGYSKSADLSTFEIKLPDVAPAQQVG